MTDADVIVGADVIVDVDVIVDGDGDGDGDGGVDRVGGSRPRRWSTASFTFVHVNDHVDDESPPPSRR